MCLLVCAYQAHPNFELIVAANRDEFYNRPTASANFWLEAPHLLAGRDLSAGGTWLGVTRNRRFAALTNIRDRTMIREGMSRGMLVRDFLVNPLGASEYLKQVHASADQYSGFNLLVLDQTGLFSYNNKTYEQQMLSPGIYGLSNATLNVAWPKVEQAKHVMKSLLSTTNINPEHPNAFFSLLADTMQASNETLPDTGIGLTLEQELSPAFISLPHYGTRCSTVLFVHRNGSVWFWERSFNTETKNATMYEEKLFKYDK